MEPSPFYDLFEGAEPLMLVFPACDCAGPFWDDEGNLVRQPDDEMAGERIEAVRLGPVHYRLACRSDGPFSCLRLYWGDEFYASTAGDGSLTLTRVVVPRPFAHHRFLTSAPFGNDTPAAMLVHELGGGWEAVAGGMLTMSVPAVRSTELLRRLAEEHCAPGALRLGN